MDTWKTVLIAGCLILCVGLGLACVLGICLLNHRACKPEPKRFPRIDTWA